MANDELNLIALAQHFSDEDKAREFVEKLRWPDGPVCPHCGEVNNAYRLEPKPPKKEGKNTHVRKGVWKCAGCREQFTVTVGTIFEDSHIPLSKWLLAYHLLCASKKGMSAHQLHRMLKVTYRSAWFMAHRIRYTMSQEPLSSKLQGIIEVDETYIGGKIRTVPQVQKLGVRPKDRISQYSNKAAVVSVLQRGGLKVKTIYQVYPKNKHQKIKDPQWIAKCGAEGWVAISGDKRIERNVENKQAVIDAKCKLFLLTDTNSLPEEWASAIILGREKISSVVRKNEGPFFATISKRSDSHVTNARFPIPRALAPEVIVGEPVIEVVAPQPAVVVQPEEEPGLFRDEPEENNEL